MYTLHPPPIVHNGNEVPKPFQSGSLPRNFAGRYSLRSLSSTLPKNFNLNLKKRCSMPTNNYNLLHNVVLQNHSNHANRKVSALGDENGFVVTIPASDKPTQLFVKIPPGKSSAIHNSFLNSSEIRRKSKAYNARLQEGDEIVSVNGRNCRNLSRDVTMSYVDGAKESLDLEVIRRDKNFNTVNASTYSISNNNPAITTGKPATIQLVPTGAFQPPVKTGVSGSVRQTTNVQTRTIPGDRTQTQQTITRTVTKKVGDGDEQSTTTREVKSFGSTPGGESTTTVIHTGGQPRAKPVVFQPSKFVGNAKPTGWSSGSQPQHRQPEPVKVGQRTTLHLQGSFDEPSQQDAKDLAELIPSQTTQMPSNVQFSMRPSLAKPQSVPKWHPPASSSSPPPVEPTKRWSAPTKTNVGKEMTITFGGPGQPVGRQPMKIPIGVAAPMTVVSSEAQPQQQTTVTKYSTRTVTTLQETTVEEESSDEEEPQIFRTTTYETKTEVSEPVSVLDDPSIILRGGFKPKDPNKVKMMRPKSFPGASVDEPDLPETDKMKQCKTIADLLMFPKNKQAKGAKMFAKRRKRSAKYTLEAYGTRGEDEELPEQIGPKTPPKPPKVPASVDVIKRLPGVPPPAPPPPPPPTTEPVFIPKLGIHVTPTDFSITKTKDKCEHKTVTPTQCGMLVADLKGASGRGASMFERRRKRSEKFVLTNEGKNPSVSPEDREHEPPKTVTLEFIAKHGQKEEQKPVIQPVQPKPPINLQRKTPWEAAMESPVGAIDSAFNHMPKKSFTGADSPTAANKPKPPAEWMTTSNILPQVPAKPPSEPKIKPRFRAAAPPSPSENGHAPSPPKFRPKFDARKQASENSSKMAYKDFNVRARGWSSSPQHSPENTPASASPASVHSADFGSGSPGLAASLPTQPLKYSGGYNNFNSKPRSFPFGSGGSYSPPKPRASPMMHDAMESDEL